MDSDSPQSPILYITVTSLMEQEEVCSSPDSPLKSYTSHRTTVT
jgi:hypothetical protein